MKGNIMKVEIKGARVEMEVTQGRPIIHINGHPVEISRDVASCLIFGDDHPQPKPTKPGVKKTTPYAPAVEQCPPKGKSGPQSAASKRKLSNSLKKYWADRKRREAREMVASRKNGKSNGMLHVN